MPEDAVNSSARRHAELRELVANDLRSPDATSRALFFEHFAEQAQAVSECGAEALARWADLLDGMEIDDTRSRTVAAIAFTAINQQLSSFKLFMSGHTVAAGGLFRQALEGVSLSLLCSTLSLTHLDRFMAKKYSTKHAVADLRRHAKTVRVNIEAVKKLCFAYDFYHKYAHLTHLTIAAGVNFSRNKVPNVGAYFDPAKLPEYQKEIAGRVSFARVLPGIVDVVRRNLGATSTTR